MKTALEWFQELPDGYRELAIANYSNKNLIYGRRYARGKFDNMAWALDTFYFDGTPEGGLFWSDVQGCYEEECNKLPPLPTSKYKVEEPFKKVKVTQDDSGHWYLIPNELYGEFNSLCEKADNGDYDAMNEVYDKFGIYRTGGDLNNIQLYTKY